MKRKILAVGLLGLCCLGLITADVSAFGLLHCCRQHRYTTHITCRPYNAFTPICWGNLVCDGCCPNPCGVASGCMPMNMGMPSGCCGNYMPYMGGMGGMCGPQGSYATDMAPPPSTNPPPTFQPPQPMPVGPGTTMFYPPNGVSQANYNPMYVPQYYYPNYYMPTYYNPYSQPMPYYWYGPGR